MTRGPENVHVSSQLFSGIEFQYLPPPPRSGKECARCRQPHTMDSLVSKWQPDHAGSRWVSEVHRVQKVGWGGREKGREGRGEGREWLIYGQQGTCCMDNLGWDLPSQQLFHISSTLDKSHSLRKNPSFLKKGNTPDWHCLSPCDF